VPLLWAVPRWPIAGPKAMLGAMPMTSPATASSTIPAFVRAAGGVRVVIGETKRGSAPLAIAESGGYRVRFPRSGEGVLINTGGGMAGGDRLAVSVEARRGAEAVMTSQAAEKIYRSEGEDAEIAISLRLEEGSRLDWLPQEQILFDGARLSRRLDVAMAGDAALTIVEGAVFGRLAMGETVRTGAFKDRWRIRRDGRLAFAEDVRLEGSIDETLARRAVGAGARALATFLFVAPGAEAGLERARACLKDAAVACGASAFDGMLVARFLAPDPAALRADLARFIERFRNSPLPRAWHM
jgi:urease accessory protein